VSLKTKLAVLLGEAVELRDEARDARGKAQGVAKTRLRLIAKALDSAVVEIRKAVEA
jgi:hypothetical protein